ncbi:glycosyltransferase [Arcticibacter tournemirensis]
MINKKQKNLPGIIFLTSFPPKECGIATYSQDLINALNNKFKNSFNTSVCALESGEEHHVYSAEVSKRLNTLDSASFSSISSQINKDPHIQIVMIQHEFGFFNTDHETDFLRLLEDINKPKIMTFHTVLPNPLEGHKLNVKRIASLCSSIIVMTRNAANVLASDYAIPVEKITIIPHGIHLVPHKNKEVLKTKYGLGGRTILSTFGLINSGKSIETSLEALPAIIKEHNNVLFLVIGKTHPTIIKQEGEKYRKMLEKKAKALNLLPHVKFIDMYLPLNDLLELLQLTDIYLFTSKDPFQAVSGTFSYAMGCGCPIVSTPIPHAREMLSDSTGILIDFQNPEQLTEAVIRILNDEDLKTTLSSNALKKIQSSAWQNVAIAYGNLFKKIDDNVSLLYRTPDIKVDHIKNLTTDFGIIQFCKINNPDPGSGYTLDDNSRAMIALMMHYKLTKEKKDIPLISVYLDFIRFCQKSDGAFFNYVDINKEFSSQNEQVNLEDANGRAIWALGYLLSEGRSLPQVLIIEAENILLKTLPMLTKTNSPRAIALMVKGLYHWNVYQESMQLVTLINSLSQKLVTMYRKKATPEWEWYEHYLTYGNSVLPEALLCAHLATGNVTYKDIARKTFDFLLDQTYDRAGIRIISNRSWLSKGGKSALFGEQPIDVAYTIIALDTFFRFFGEIYFLQKMKTAFNWFLGQNHLHRIVYNPSTGGCYDGLEESSVNLNQGAESTVTYLIARLTWEKYKTHQTSLIPSSPRNHIEPY